MKILAIDSSGMVASVALVEDNVLRAEFTVNNKQTHSQTLLPMLEELKESLGLELETVDAIAIAAGPGSFTGLRIGSATAKGLGLALCKPLVEVPTLEGLAYNLYGTEKLVCPMMDARRSQVYTGIYEYVGKDTAYELHVLEPQCAVEVTQILEKCNRLGREVIFLGDGVPVYADRIREKMQVPYSLAPAHVNRQRAGSVAALGAVYAARGQLVSAAEHQPEYLRKSQAEREREAESDHTGA